MIAHRSSQLEHVTEIRGDFACWSPPEMKVERYSYPCPTPGAARGALEAIYFKPEFFWQVTDAADQKGRTQRRTMAVRDPRFRVWAKTVPRPGHEAKQKAFDQQFIRRASQGKCFQQPSLGCREFVAFFRYVKEDELKDHQPVDYSCNGSP